MIRFRLRLHVQEFELTAGETIIGRGDTCSLTIDDPLLSREHACIRLDGGRVTVVDLGSRNGTRVNGELITGEVELHDGDRIKIGSTETVFSRVLTPRRDVMTTASIRTCPSCRTTHVAQAPTCPHCGHDANKTGAPRTESQRRRDFWLSLEVELLQKALELFRLDEAADSMRRLSEKLDALLDSGKTFEVTQLEAALCAGVRYGRTHGTGRAVGWALSVLRRMNRLPGPELFALIAATAPILLEDALGELEGLIASQRARSLNGTEQSCLASLEKLRDEVVTFRAQRHLDTVPRAAAPLLQC